MPPDYSQRMSYGPPAQTGGYPTQPNSPYPSAGQTGYGNYGQSPAPYDGGQYQSAPYGPPMPQNGPLYGDLPPGAASGVPTQPDPYAWQRAAVQAPQATSAAVTPDLQPFAPQPAAYTSPSYAQQQFTSAATAQSPVYGLQMMNPAASAYQMPQQPMAQMGQSLQFAPSPYDQVTPLQKILRNRRLVGIILMSGLALLVLIIIVVISVLASKGGGSSQGITVGGVDGHSSAQVSPEQLLQTALGNALQTKSYSQKVANVEQDVERKIDVSDVRSPQISGRATINDSGTQLTAFAGLNDTYVRLSKASILSAKPTQANKWVQVRKAGKLLDMTGTGGTSLDVLFTPTVALYNGFIFGNYSDTDRTAMLSIIKDQLVYRYDPSLVTQGEVDGQAVSQFTVTVSSSGQQALAAKASQVAGVDQQRIAEAATIARLSGSANTELTLSVSNKDQRIIQVRQGGDDGTTITFSGFDATKPDQAPKAELTWDDYVKQLSN